MQFAAAGHPNAEELLAFTDGEASPQVEGHVEGCTACATEVEAFASIQAALRETLYRFDCPAPHALGESRRLQGGDSTTSAGGSMSK